MHRPSDLATILATVEAAKLLRERTDLSSSHAAVIAVIDAMEMGAWPARPIEELFGESAERDELRAALAQLVDLCVVIDGAHGLALDPAVRGVLAQELAPAATASNDLGRLIEPSGAAIVLAGGTPRERLAALRAATTRAIGVLGPETATGAGPETAIEALRDLWLDGAIAVIELAGELGAVERSAQVPVRLVISTGQAQIGETLARLRKVRPVLLWRLAAVAAARAPVPPALEPLVSTRVNGARVASPAIRVAGLRGTSEAIVRAAQAVAAAHGVALQRTPGELVAVRDALAAAPAVLLVERLALAPLEAHAIAAMIERGAGIVLIAAELPPPIARVSPTIVDVG